MMNDVSNTYRIYYDNEDSWTDLEDKIKYFGENWDQHLVNYSRPGSWSDADQVR